MNRTQTVSNGTAPITVGSFPYSPGFNPYQRLFTQAIEGAGLQVLRIPPTKWFPLQCAAKQKCDLLHLDWPHDWYRGKSAFSRILKRQMFYSGLRKLAGKPTVWTAHNLAAHNAKDPNDEHRMMQLLINRCNGIMVMSEAAKKLLTERFRVGPHTDVRVIYHGHYAGCYSNQVSRIDARRELGIAADQFVYLSLGSIQPYKGHLELIQDFVSVAEANDVLLIAGASKDPEYVNQLHREIKANDKGQRVVRIDPSEIPGEKLQVYFNAADVCVFPFTDILNSGSVLLAMTFRKLVIAPQLGSIPEIVHPQSYVGYNPSQPGALKAGLICAKEKVKCFNEKALHDFVTTKYNWERIGHQLRQWYAEILGIAC